MCLYSVFALLKVMLGHGFFYVEDAKHARCGFQWQLLDIGGIRGLSCITSIEDSILACNSQGQSMLASST